MKQKNPKLMIALTGLGLVVFLGFVYSISHHGNSGTTAVKQVANPNTVSAYDLQSGDTNTEVLNTVVANQKKLAQKNAELEQEVQKGQAQQIGAVKNSFTDQLNAIKDQLQAEINTQKSALSGNANNNNSQNNVGYFVNGGSGSFGISQQPSGVIGTVGDISQAFSQSVIQGTQNIQNNVAAVYAQDQAKANGAVTTVDTQKQNQPTLMYSIPDGSTIGSVYMMTATLAEVPVSGRLIAPAWPFKAIIGSQDLMGTNGQMLPSQISGAIIQGHAVGNMGQKCANLYVDKITYTFNDGHFWVYPNGNNDNSSNDGTQVYPSHSLGYLALPDGTQCITGLYLTDAPQVLLNLTALGAATNAGNTMANQQVSTVSNVMTGQTGTSITGSAGKLFGWSALAGGSTAALNYYQQRVSDIFDAIFLPSSTNHQPTKLIWNVQKTIPIEYDSSTVMNSSKTDMSSNLNNLD